MPRNQSAEFNRRVAAGEASQRQKNEAIESLRTYPRTNCTRGSAHAPPRLDVYKRQALRGQTVGGAHAARLLVEIADYPQYQDALPVYPARLGQSF